MSVTSSRYELLQLLSPGLQPSFLFWAITHPTGCLPNLSLDTLKFNQLIESKQSSLLFYYQGFSSIILSLVSNVQMQLTLDAHLLIRFLKSPNTLHMLCSSHLIRTECGVYKQQSFLPNINYHYILLLFTSPTEHPQPHAYDQTFSAKVSSFFIPNVWQSQNPAKEDFYRREYSHVAKTSLFLFLLIVHDD